MTSDNTPPKVLLPVEIKSRELSGKLFLATVLADRGYDVYIGNKLQHTALDKINPDVYFELSGKDHAARLRRLKEHGIRTLILETEGAAFHGVESFSRALGSDTLEYTDCYCAWGTVAEDTVEAVAPDTQIKVTGNPRFDLLQSPYRQLYTRSANRLNSEYGEFILFNTNFGLPVGDKSMAHKMSYYDDDDPNKDRLLELSKRQTKILGEFTRLIAETAEEFPDRNIVVRPHPSEDTTFYENCLYSYDNVCVERELEARPWIMAADVVVHNSCTTGVASALLETPVISYVPDDLDAYQKFDSRSAYSPPNEVSEQCHTRGGVHSTIKQYLENESEYALDGYRKSVISKYINNIDYLSSDRIANVMDSLIRGHSRKRQLPVDNKLRARRILVRMLGTKRFEDIYVKGIQGEERHKYPYTETEEISEIISRFPNGIMPDGLHIERLPYVVNGFRLHCDN